MMLCAYEEDGVEEGVKWKKNVRKMQMCWSTAVTGAMPGSRLYWVNPEQPHALNTLFSSSCYLIPLKPEMQPFRGLKAVDRMSHLLRDHENQEESLFGNSTWYSEWQ